MGPLARLCYSQPVVLGSILLATALGPGSSPAARRALQLAQQHAATLHVLHVIEPAESFATFRGRLRALLGAGATSPEHVEESVEHDASARLQTRFAGVSTAAGPVLTAVRAGTSAEEIVSFADAVDAELIVLGAVASDGAPGVGTTAERVVRRATRPVLLVRHQPLGPYRRVLVGVDFSPPSRAALAAALRLAPEADVVTGHAADAVFEARLRHTGAPDAMVEQFRAQLLDLVGQELDALLAEVVPEHSPVRTSVRSGRPSTVLLDLARLTRAELLVVGGSGIGRIDRLLLGSVAVHVMREAVGDVLVVP